jgi:hypothetical protein
MPGMLLTISPLGSVSTNSSSRLSSSAIRSLVLIFCPGDLADQGGLDPSGGQLALLGFYGRQSLLGQCLRPARDPPLLRHREGVLSAHPTGIDCKVELYLRDREQSTLLGKIR